MLHERKLQSSHEHFCYLISKLLPQPLLKRNIVVVTDGENSCSNALMTVFPQWHVLNCWNHVIRDVEFWLKMT